MAEKKRKPRATGTRTEVFAMRLDPKLKYLAEIAARKQRRSLANFIEWAIEEALATVKVGQTSGLNVQHDVTVRDTANILWDLEPSDRLIKLAENYPDLMTYEEQLIWKAIFEITAEEHYQDEAGKNHYTTFAFCSGEDDNKRADRSAIKYCWPTLAAYAAGNATEADVQAELITALQF